MYDLHSLPGSIRSQIMAANLPIKTLGMQFSDLDKSDTLEQVKAWVESVKAGEVIQAIGEPTCGVGLLLVGDPGHGKTTMASVALQELIQTMPHIGWGNPEGRVRRPSYFSDYPRLLRMQKAQWSDEKSDENQLLLDSIYGEANREHDVRVFVLDDLGKEYRTASGWAENNFDALLRARFNAGLPTIVTTNIPMQDWGSVYGKAMGSFAHESFIPIVVKSEQGDRRR